MAKSSRSRARERKKQREQQRQRNRRLMILGGIIAVVAVIALLIVVSNLPADAPVSEDVVDRYENYRTGTTEEGYYRLGNEDAPVRVVEYASFSCPACENFHSTVFPQLVSRIEAGQINFTYIPLQTGSIPNAEGAARTALCAGEQGKFWEMHDVLFNWHSSFGNNAFVGNRLTAGIEALGLDAGTFNNCFDSGRISTTLQNALQEGVGSTPTVQVNGTTVDASAQSILSTIDSLLPASEDYESGLIEPGAVDEGGETEAEPTAVEETDVDEPAAEETEAVEATEES